MNATEQELAINVDQEITIAAPPERVFAAMLDQFGPKNEQLPMVLEPRPGGRWFRDLGEDAGHLWGHVQVIKPPTLLELTGPMFMSYPAINHMQVRVTGQDEGSLVTLKHTAFGKVDAHHRDGVTEGWQHLLGAIKDDAERA